MRTRLLASISIAACVFAASARDFTYKNIIYTVIDEDAKTVETKAGHVEKDEEDKDDYIPGNTGSIFLNLPSKVYDGNTEYTLTRIGEYSFCVNKYLISVNIPSTVKEIGDYAFYVCPMLSDVEFNSPDTSLGEYCFAGCITISSIDLPANLDKIPTGAFALCWELTNIVIPDKVTTINVSAFNGAGLENVTLPNSLTMISAAAFSNTNLKSVYLPSNLFLLALQAFSGCKELKAIYYNTTSPALCFGDPFDETIYKSAVLYVPQNAKSAFESASVWKDFTNIVEKDFSGVEEISVDENAPVEYYDLNGVQITDPKPGQMVIKRQGHKSTKVIM